jgi:hypothetical protein
MLDRGVVAANTGTGELVDLLAKNDSRADENGASSSSCNRITIDGSAPEGLIAMCQDES